MKEYPKYIKVGKKKYKINTDFRVAIRCEQIAEDHQIGTFEKVLAIIYLLLGEEAMNDFENIEKIFSLLKKYLLCGKPKEKDDEKPDMDYNEDYQYIKTSFRSDYGINLDEQKMHWWEFSDLINGLSNSELGNCCILNRVRNIRNFDVSQIKDEKEKKEIIKAKKYFELEKNKRSNNITKKQEESLKQFNKMAKL